MKTPVIIPAHNEEGRIAQTLRRLPSEGIEPIVAVNGSVDQTAAIAATFGATVLEFERPGKLPAIQESLRHLGDRALRPVVLLDADNRPVFPRTWLSTMVRATQPESATPRVVSAPAWFTYNPEAAHSGQLSAVMRTLTARAQLRTKVYDSLGGKYYGPNQALKLADGATLDEFMALPSIWPKEDVAVAKIVTEHGGQNVQLADWRAVTLNPESICYEPLLDYALHLDDAVRRSEEHYHQTGPVDAITYEQWEESRKSA